MNERIRETAQKYRQLAQDIMTFEVQERLDSALPIDVQTSLLRLYYAKRLEARLEKCEALLTDETDQSVFDALSDAAEAIDEAALTAMTDIEQYGREDRDFSRMIDQLSVSSVGEGLADQLCKLYKCESIIKMTYDYASAHSYSSTPEEYIEKRMDIDMEALLDLRQSLLDDISKALGESE